ncbi:hypothetical protein BGZ60DRAFT_434887 [Tricladium varicosporioides]|nr:hypothetical protein BGZ60DRAFT_434887 [Hymenoscyphus varicosporioides]
MWNHSKESSRANVETIHDTFNKTSNETFKDIKNDLRTDDSISAPPTPHSGFKILASSHVLKLTSPVVEEMFSDGGFWKVLGFATGYAEAVLPNDDLEVDEILASITPHCAISTRRQISVDTALRPFILVEKYEMIHGVKFSWLYGSRNRRQFQPTQMVQTSFPRWPFDGY